MASLILFISAFVQFTAAAIALGLLRTTGHKLAWGCVAVALFLMGVRRSITLYHVTIGDVFLPAVPTAEIVALGISCLMLFGVVMIGSMFREAKVNECLLENQKERFRDYAECASDWFWEMDKDLRFTEFSGNQEIVNWLKLNAIGKTRWELVKVDPDTDSFWQAHKVRLESHLPFRKFEFNIKKHIGQTMWTQVSGVPVYDDNGDFAGYRGTASDVTDIKLSEERVRLNEERYIDAAHLARLGHWTYDEVEDRFIYCSEELARIHNLTQEQYKELYSGTQLDIDRVHPDDRERYGEILRGAQKDASSYEVEYRVILSDGSIRHLHEKGEPICDDEGNLLKSAGTVQDITDRKNTEAQLIQTSKLASLGEMATGIAHEINQPLNIIRMSDDTLEELLEENDLDVELMSTHVERISKQLDRATIIIDHMRTFGREASEEASPIRITNVVNEALKFIGEQLRLRNIEIDVDCPESCRPVLGHATQLEQVMLNLLTNARDAIESNGKINGHQGYISIRINDDPGKNHIDVIISDSGGGIPDSVIGSIFDPFFTTKEVGKGTGVGLSISHGIVSNMGGAITASNIKDGTEFKVSLPVMS